MVRAAAVVFFSALPSWWPTFVFLSGATAGQGLAGPPSGLARVGSGLVEGPSLPRTTGPSPSTVVMVTSEALAATRSCLSIIGPGRGCTTVVITVAQWYWTLSWSGPSCCRNKRPRPKRNRMT